jgi:2-oxoglutarate ferredoxin oxidoreductase subunit beta
LLTESHDKGEIITGLFYLNTQQEDFLTLLNVVDEPLATLPESKVRPPKEVLEQVMQALM